MKWSTLLLIGLLVQSTLQCQDLSLSSFDNLIGKTWKATGTWGDGSTFTQEVQFEYGLNGHIIIARSKGFIDKEQSEYGDRNLGIRIYDPTSGAMNFWEFDVFGGVIKGQVLFDGKDMLYQYQYGDSNLTDRWSYLDDENYNFTVGIWEEDSWNQIFLTTTFQATHSEFKGIIPDLTKSLVGQWKAPAWDGFLYETWKVGVDGHLHQKAEYLEEGKVVYASSSKIEKVGDELILFSVIKENNPKIFKATSISETEIVFENSEYTNPNQVIYSFKEGAPFRRTIRGLEDGKPTSFTFLFEKDPSN